MIHVSVDDLFSLRDRINVSSSDLYLTFGDFSYKTDVGYALDGIDFFIEVLVSVFEVGFDEQNGLS